MVLLVTLARVVFASLLDPLQRAFEPSAAVIGLLVPATLLLVLYRAKRLPAIARA